MVIERMYQSGTNVSETKGRQMSETSQGNGDDPGSNPAGVADLKPRDGTGIPGTTEQCSVKSTKQVPDAACDGGTAEGSLGHESQGQPARVTPGLASMERLAIRVWEGRGLRDRGPLPIDVLDGETVLLVTGWWARLVDENEIPHWTGGPYDDEGNAIHAAQIARAHLQERARGDDEETICSACLERGAPIDRADVDPIEAAVALIRGAHGYAGARGRIGRALIAVMREHERVWDRLADNGGMDAPTLAAARDMRDAELCALIAAIGGAL